MMFANFEYRLNRREHVLGLRVIAAVQTRQDLKARAPLLLAVMLVIGFAVWAFRSSPGAILATVLLIGLVQMALRWRELLSSFDPATADVEARFDATSAIELRRSAERRWSWDAIRRIHDLPEAVVLEFAGWNHLIIPDRLWTDPDQRFEFVRQVRDHASHLEPDFNMEGVGTASRVGLLALGSVAAAIDALFLLMVVTGPLTCNCAVRHLVGNSRTVGTLVSLGSLAVLLAGAYFAGALSHVGLKRLSKHRPRVASACAYLFIAIMWAAVIAALILLPPFGFPLRG